MQILAGTTSPWGAGLTLKWTPPAMELIMTVRECMQQKVPLRTGCVPVETRSGWAHDRPCACDKHEPIMNCAGNRSQSTATFRA